MSFKPRAGQREFERGVIEHRIAALVARRQFGKTSISARIALKKMMKKAGHTVIFGSVKLDLGREIVRKEAAELQRAFQSLQSGSKLLQLTDEKGSELPSKLSPDDFAELYEATRLELRLYHDRTTYSRTKVVALTPDAVGETGDVILDEVGRCKKFREVWEAMRPIISSNPEYRAILTTTPPPDDTHFSFELLSPPVGVDLPINPKGNWYRSDLGLWVLRVTAEDAYADGVPLYDDDSGLPISPAESRAKDYDREAWDRNYGCKFIMGGTAACGLLLLDTAQQRGIGQCEFVQVQDESDFLVALKLVEKLGPGKVGLGWDLATTTNATSNPSSFTIMELVGVEYYARLIVTWKTADPDVALERVRALVRAVKNRPVGGAARRLSVDATNERYFAQSVKKALRSEVPVELVVGSEGFKRPGAEPMTMKQHLGGQLIGTLEDNHLILPAHRYVKEDFRLPRKEKGQIVCDPAPDGKHGDTFDSTKLAQHSLRVKSGSARAEAVNIGSVGPRHDARRNVRFEPRSTKMLSA